MLTRRDILKITSFIATTGLAPVASAVQPARKLDELCVAIADPTSAESVEFAARLASHGAQVLQLSELTDRFWFDALRSVCNSEPQPTITGLINRPQALELEVFAEDAFYYPDRTDHPLFSEKPMYPLTLIPMRRNKV